MLRGLGYQVTVEQARAEEVGTNAMSYGSSVPLTDVRIIALALARAGAQLRRICPFRESSGRSNVVQVIGSSISERFPPLSVKDLESIAPGPLPPCPSGPASARRPVHPSFLEMHSARQPPQQVHQLQPFRGAEAGGQASFVFR